MKILFNTALIIAAITSLAYAQEGQARLSPSEINSLASYREAYPVLVREVLRHPCPRGLTYYPAE